METGALQCASLVELVALAKPLLQQAECECPRTGPGRPPTIPDWVMGALIMVAILKRRKSKSSQYRFLQRHQAELQEWLGTDKFPVRSTYFDRYRRAHRLFEIAIRLQGRLAIRKGQIDVDNVAVDKSLFRAKGPAWHQSQRRKGVLPRGVDRDARWGYSPHHGWVYGYGFEIVVTAAKTGVVFPLLASVETANTSEKRTFPGKIPQLPRQTKHVLADSGYDTNDIGEAIEWTREGKRTGRRFLCRHVQQNRPSTTPWRETHRRRQRRERREARIRYGQTKKAKRLYRRRSARIEPFNQWFKTLFQLDHQAWHRGIDNNRTQVLAAIFCYQALIRYNRRHKQNHGQIQAVLDCL